MKDAIATVKFVRAGQAAEAYLGPDRRWTCPTMPVVAAALNMMYPILDDSPAVGTPGLAEAHAAALYLNGTIHFEPAEPAPAGVDF